MIGTVVAVATLLGCGQGTNLVVEAENGRLFGVLQADRRPGFSGTGYITGLDSENDRIELVFHGPAGEYAVVFRFCSPSGPKGVDASFDGQPLSTMLPRTGEAWAEQSIGRVVMRGRSGTLTVRRGWGYYDLDRVALAPVAKVPSPAAVPAQPCDPEATSKARALLAYLGSVYGKATLTGQIGEGDERSVRRLSGKSSAIVAGDLMDYSPSRRERGAQPGDLSERLIQSARDGSIVSLLWHWNAPSGLDESQWYEGFQARATTFDVRRALTSSASWEHRLLLRDIDAIAAELRKFERARVPVLWRPLHEADQEGFWWGVHGPDAFRKLWRLLYDRLTKHHGLHHLLWVCTLSDPSWYPGDDVVDVVGIDAYPSDPLDLLTGEWDRMRERFDGRKMLALTEVAGVPDIEAMHARGVRWSFFISWRGRLGPSFSPDDVVRRTYRSPLAVTLEKLPARSERGF